MIESSSILLLIYKLIQWVYIVLDLLWLFLILLLLFNKFLEHLFLMFSWNMIFKNIFFHLFSTLCTFIHSLRTIFQMQLHISLFNSQSTLLRTFNFKFIYYLLQAHIRLESLRQINLAIWTLLRSQLAETGFANYCSALSTIERWFWKIETDNTFQLLEIKFLRL